MVACSLVFGMFLWLTLGRFDKADAIFEGVSLWLPNLALPLLGRGLVALTQARVRDALQLFRRAQAKARGEGT